MEFAVRSTSADSAEVSPVVLSEAKTTRKVFKPEIVRKVGEPRCVLRGFLVHQRRGTNGQWEEVEHIDLRKLKAGEGVAYQLHSEELLKLMRSVDELTAIAEREGIRFGKRQVVVADRNKVIPVSDPERRKTIEALISRDYGHEFWNTLAQVKPELAKKFSYAQLHIEREKSLVVFRQHLKAEDWNEPQWEQFFFENQWIFGYGLRYQFLGILQRQAGYGGGTYERRGEQKGEFLTRTLGVEKFTVIVEIKRPDTKLFDSGRRSAGGYRSGVPNYSAEFIQAISQSHVNGRTWDTEGSKRERDRELLAADHINTITPRSILVIGNTCELDDFDKKNAFELFRRELKNPDVITFDELEERAKYIVSQTPAEGPLEDVEEKLTDGDIPF
jgi:hypothetical protein